MAAPAEEQKLIEVPASWGRRSTVPTRFTSVQTAVAVPYSQQFGSFSGGTRKALVECWRTAA